MRRANTDGVIAGEEIKIRVPYINTLPNKKVHLRDVENRGKFSKFENARKTQESIAKGETVSNSNGYSTDNCSNCGAYADDYFVNTPEWDVVCRKCGAVQPSERAFEGAVERNTKLSSPYRQRTYFSERLRLFGNLEPRIPKQDIRLIGQVYSELCTLLCTLKSANHSSGAGLRALETELKAHGLYGWFDDDPRAITKDFIKTLLTLIDKHISVPSIRGTTKSFKKKYLERWLQIKIFLCGEHYFKNNISELPDKDLLNTMLSLACHISILYKTKKEEIGLDEVRKKSHPNVDLLFLLILYNLGELNKFAWYFVSKKILHNGEFLLRKQQKKLSQAQRDTLTDQQMDCILSTNDEELSRDNFLFLNTHIVENYIEIPNTQNESSLLSAIEADFEIYAKIMRYLNERYSRIEVLEGHPSIDPFAKFGPHTYFGKIENTKYFLIDERWDIPDRDTFLISCVYLYNS